MLFVPFMSSEGITFPPNVGFDLASKLVRHTAAGSLHSTVEMKEEVRVCVCVYVERMKQPREEMKGSITLNLLVLLYFREQFVSSSCLFFHTAEDFFYQHSGTNQSIKDSNGLFS